MTNKIKERTNQVDNQAEITKSESKNRYMKLAALDCTLIAIIYTILHISLNVISGHSMTNNVKSHLIIFVAFIGGYINGYWKAGR